MLSISSLFFSVLFKVLDGVRESAIILTTTFTQGPFWIKINSKDHFLLCFNQEKEENVGSRSDMCAAEVAGCNRDETCGKLKRI